jgi:shikimate dehydrogenase
MSVFKKFAVIGSPIDHSLSPKIHSIFAKELGIEITYEAIKVEPIHFDTSVNRLFDEGYAGLNVTLPLKELAFNYADELTEDSNLSGSVNTLWKEDGTIHGDSTDGRGLVRDLQEKKINLKNKEIVILGAGGAAKAIIPSLLREDPKRISIGNRTLAKAEELIESYSSSSKNKINLFEMSENLNFKPDIIVNATSAGIKNESIELPGDLLSKDIYVYDLSYSLEDTPVIKLVKSRGIEKYHDGIGMLIHQAALSFKIWNNQTPNTNISKAELL